MVERGQRNSPEKLSLVVFSGAFDRVHYALVLASGAAAVGKPVTLFFTMEATRALLQADTTGKAPWAALPAPPPFGEGGAMDAAFKARNVGDFETLIEACRDMGVTFMVCEMGLRALQISVGQLRDDIEFQSGGVVTFLQDASRDGAMMFI